MSEDGGRGSGSEQRECAGRLGEDEVVAFLRDCPDLLDRHPQLIESLHVPHDCGGADSLLEYQVKRLRLRVGELESRLQDLLGSARQNEVLSRRLNRLVVSLLDCDGFDELATRIYEGLETAFGVEHVRLRLFARPRQSGDRGLGEFLGRGHPARSEFALVLQGGKPVCGPLSPAQCALLFGSAARGARPAGGRGTPGVASGVGRDRLKTGPADGNAETVIDGIGATQAQRAGGLFLDIDVDHDLFGR